MRISEWSSDVCSSGLGHAPRPVRRAARAPQSAFVPMNASRPAKARIPIGDQRSLPLLGRLWREFVRPYIPWLLGAVVASAVVAAATAASAWLLAPVVNNVFVECERALPWLIGGPLLAVFLIKS